MTSAEQDFGNKCHHSTEKWSFFFLVFVIDKFITNYGMHILILQFVVDLAV